MKRLIFIAAIIFAAASMAQAQIPKVSQSRGNQVHFGAVSCEKNINTDKLMSSSPASNLTRVNKTVEPVKVPNPTNPVRTTNPSKPYLHESWKQNTPNVVYQNFFQSRANSIFNDAYEKMMWAQERRADAMKALSELPEKQRLEKAKLLERFEKSMPEGWENEPWMVEEMQKLEKKHAKQLAKAKEKLEKATRSYDRAVKRVQDARVDIYRLAMVKYR